ncbi:GpE family phage tail protein [Cereibacter changlensis]|uniref:GpE family phage tail protein n=2 Tax=Cereibacter changlensis TaxID=402884 RepID=A0A2T4JJH1_9RHOB|nr:GpE family phage tail protein [Cereibacter changlensis]PTE18061.1 GpE family phage tail protein [Cereibacter changlensis JA139]PTE18065.1 GpE family phage tail protein [Cereibacter changlensis JA139]PZX50433.1 GpE protein [Cereibacter changlensis]TKA94465.1 GpE family phage tail protein [Cereibacter changlensis]
MADIAIVFHWPPAAMDPMCLEELARWWAKARARAAPEESDG